MDREAREHDTARKRFDLYQILIHTMLVALAGTVVGLTHENRALREPSTAEYDQLEQGDAFAAFPALDLESRSRFIDFKRSERETLVFVFTTVCPACRENQANWRMLYEEAEEHYDIVGISLNDLEATTEYREANDLPFPVVVPDDIRGFATTHKISQVPLTLRVDRDSRVHSARLGVLDEDSLAIFREAASS